MSQEMSNIAKEKLAALTADLKRAAVKIGQLAKENPDQEDQIALGILNDKVALYLQDVILMVADDRELDVPVVIEYVDLIEKVVSEIDSI